jgi:chromosome segregation ATPase
MNYILFMLKNLADDAGSLTWLLYTSIGGAIGFIGKYLIERLNADKEIDIAKIQYKGSSEEDKLKRLIKELEEYKALVKDLREQNQELERRAYKCKITESVLSLKLNTVIDLMKDLNKDRPEIVRMLENIEKQNAHI